MVIQCFTGLPLLQQIETVLVFDIAKNGIVQATRFLSRRLDQGEKRLRKLQIFFRKYVHCYPDNDHEKPPLRKSEFPAADT
jgi:hypothetical protein